MELAIWPAPYRIETPRVTLRCFDPQDAPAVKSVLDRQRTALGPWLDLPSDEEPLDRMVARLRRFRAQFDAGETFHYAALVGGDVVGSMAVEPIAGQGLLIGGWIDPALARHGYTREALDAVCAIAFGVGIARFVELRIRADNAPSQRLAASLGFAHEATLRGRVIASGVAHDETIWTRMADARPPALTDIRATDAIGHALV